MHKDPEKLPKSIVKPLSATPLTPDEGIPPMPDSCYVYEHMDIESNILMIEVGGHVT